jgi:hypothetical protein
MVNNATRCHAQPQYNTKEENHKIYSTVFVKMSKKEDDRGVQQLKEFFS